MKALIITHGTRGDVQPYVALAYALQETGHNAPCWALRKAIETNYRGLRGKLTAVRLTRAKAELRKVYDEIAEVPADDVDVLVHPINSPVQHLAEKRGLPAVAVGLQPGWVPTSSFPSPMVPFGIPKALNQS